MDIFSLVAAQSEYAIRRLQEPAFDCFYPLAGTSAAGSEAGFQIAVKDALKERADPKTMTIDAILSDESEPDRAKEILVLDGADLEGWARNPLGLFQHNKMMPVSLFKDPQTNQFTVTKMGKKLRGKYHMIQNGPMAPIAEQVFQLVESGVLNGNSVGFIASWKDYQRIPENPSDQYGPAIVKITKSKLFECSLVFIPENDRSLVTSVVRKGLGGSGSGPKALMPPLMNMLAPYADPEAIWSSSGWSVEDPDKPTVGTKEGGQPKPPAAKPDDPPVEDKEDEGESEREAKAVKDGKCTGCGCGLTDADVAHQTAARAALGMAGKLKIGYDAMKCKKCCESYAAGTKKGKSMPDATQTAAAKELTDKAARAEYYEKTIGSGFSLPLDDYKGRPGQKALNAIHDMAMWSATAALDTLDKVDAGGPVEKSIAGFVYAQQELALRCCVAYKEVTGEEAPWSTFTAEQLYTAKDDANVGIKGMVNRTVDWLVKFKGYRKATAAQLVEAAKFLAEVSTTDGVPADVRSKCIERAKTLEAVVDRNGNMIPTEDIVAEKKLKALESTLERQESEIKTLRRQVQRAQAGAY